jgi:hypothetical protein
VLCCFSFEAYSHAGLVVSGTPQKVHQPDFPVRIWVKTLCAAPRAGAVLAVEIASDVLCVAPVFQHSPQYLFNPVSPIRMPWFGIAL